VAARSSGRLPPECAGGYGADVVNWDGFLFDGWWPLSFRPANALDGWPCSSRRPSALPWRSDQSWGTSFIVRHLSFQVFIFADNFTWLTLSSIQYQPFGAGIPILSKQLEAALAVRDADRLPSKQPPSEARSRDGAADPIPAEIRRSAFVDAEARNTLGPLAWFADVRRHAPPSCLATRCRFHCWFDWPASMRVFKGQDEPRQQKVTRSPRQTRHGRSHKTSWHGNNPRAGHVARRMKPTVRRLTDTEGALLSEIATLAGHEYDEVPVKDLELRLQGWGYADKEIKRALMSLLHRGQLGQAGPNRVVGKSHNR
jgi:hypothetical protein